MEAVTKSICRIAELEEIVELRYRILRPNRPKDTAYFDIDRLDTTVHFGLFVEDIAYSCFTLGKNEYKGELAFQLRGMATDSIVQGKGYGRQLMEFMMFDWAPKNEIKLLWCNARIEAVPFYEKLGWKIDSDKFMIDPIGFHFKMFVEL